MGGDGTAWTKCFAHKEKAVVIRTSRTSGFFFSLALTSFGKTMISWSTFDILWNWHNMSKILQENHVLFRWVTAVFSKAKVLVKNFRGQKIRECDSDSIYKNLIQTRAGHIVKIISILELLPKILDSRHSSWWVRKVKVRALVPISTTSLENNTLPSSVLHRSNCKWRDLQLLEQKSQKSFWTFLPSPSFFGISILRIYFWQIGVVHQTPLSEPFILSPLTN